MNLEATVNKSRVKRAFSRQAPVYEENASLQTEVAHKLVSFISEPKTPNSGLRTLDIGIGTGLATKAFTKKFPQAGTFGCDIAWGMLKEASRTGLVLAEADAESLPYKDDTFDIAFSNLAFQWTNLEHSLAEALRVIRPDGRMYFSTFGSETLRELADSYSSAWRSLNIKGIPKIMRFESPHKIKTIMESLGFMDVMLRTDLIKRHYHTPKVLLRSLKVIGAGNPSKDFHPPRTLLQETFRIYKDRYGDKEGVTATFEVVYGGGVKG